VKARQLGVLTSACAACLSSGAAAQENPRSSILEEVIVTAQKRDQNLQDIPVAVTAFTAEARELVGIETVQDMTLYTPGLTYNTTLDRLNLRGVGRYTNDFGSDPGVAVYNDGVYTSSTTSGSKSSLFNERVEVLRGPQGTLFGRNAVGGAMNIVAKRPSDAFQTELRAGAGNYESWKVEGAVSGPLNDALRVRVAAGHYIQEEGYFRNLQGGPGEGGVEDRQDFDVSLEADLGERVDMYLRWYRGVWDLSGRSSASQAPYVTHRAAVPPATRASLVPTANLGPSSLYNTGDGLVPVSNAQLYTEQLTGDRRTYNTNIPARATLDGYDAVIMHLTWRAGWADLKYIGGYSDYVYKQVTDYDRAARDFYDYTPVTAAGVPSTRSVRIWGHSATHYQEHKEYYSNELNLTSSREGPWQWILGLYQYDEDSRQPSGVLNALQPEIRTPLRATNFQPAAPNPEGWYYFAYGELEIDSYAAFGQVDWQFAQNWKGVLGVRYSEDEKRGDEFHRQILWNPTALTALGGVSPALEIVANSRSVDNKWSGWSGTAALEWSPTDDLLTYLKFSRGWKGGAFNLGTVATDYEVDPEVLEAYELGLKFGSERLVTNVAIYSYDYSDLQSPISVVQEVGPNITQYTNLDAEIRGVEVETTWQAADPLTLMLTYSYIDSEFTSGCGLSDSLDPLAAHPQAKPCGAVRTGASGAVISRGQSIIGDTLPAQPEHKVAFNASYRIDFAAGALNLSGTYAWRDEVQSGLFSRDYRMAQSFDQVDLRATWTDSQNRYEISAYGRNVFDELGLDATTGDRQDDGTILQTWSLTPPRTYGVEFQYRFGR
jgi:iron complex outermembrane receptor protein